MLSDFLLIDTCCNWGFFSLSLLNENKNEVCTKKPNDEFNEPCPSSLKQEQKIPKLKFKRKLVNNLCMQDLSFFFLSLLFAFLLWGGGSFSFLPHQQQPRRDRNWRRGVISARNISASSVCFLNFELQRQQV